MLTQGRKEYPSLDDPAVIRELYTELSAQDVPSVMTGSLVVPHLAMLIWRSRSDLLGLFDVNRPEGAAGLLVWFYGCGLHELGLRELTSQEDLASLHQPVDGRHGGAIPLSRLMEVVWLARADLQAAIDITQPAGVSEFIHWYLVHGLTETGLIEALDVATARQLAGVAPRFLYEYEVGWSQEPAAGALRTWLRSEGLQRYPVIERLYRVAGQPIEADIEAPMVQPVRSVPLRHDGVNLIGHARSEFGVGEDVREAARALTAAGIPFAVIDIPPGSGIGQGDRLLDQQIGDRLPFSTSLFCMTAMETARLHADRGDAIFQGRRTIGFWPWELPQWPEGWRHCFDLVDEVWASSRFTYGAYRAVGGRKVRHMPMAVTVAGAASDIRVRLGTRDGTFLFVCAFDGLSGMPRKNPLAVVAAFREAFPSGNEPVSLVVKGMRATVGSEELYRQLEEACRQDPRIHLIDGTWARSDMLGLLQAADCFVSLHRAEGFGRCLAEAMLLGKPVIATGYSGNMDFTLPGTAALVDHDCRPVEPGEYPYAEGMIWAEPDISHAAWWMRHIWSEPVNRNRLEAAGQWLIQQTYSPKVIGQSYAGILGLRS
ncbi:glycosyltransferase family 4 protein [Niveispirillum sp. BGYR6]|uniref:glycosyltransferase family 4 protein n=1 Tax=Niveispirillum sp. BGYR6 TaxID=2971249 RepID=UPI0022B94933|nr:glycosyltransferase family 4 protein [Niveispirillum sp. BGYR6]MDG5497952.1 glycosyltransferase family 4 protein [Niveispirillum sp. BGYR6]